MNILISNDDGIAASGIKFLSSELEKNHQVTVIAPDKERSSCGHGLTLGAPLRVTKIKDNYYSCSGYPADCVLVGLGNLLKDNRPDIVVSGINHGANLGQDRFYSGTIAAAREATFREVPSIAVSLVTKNIKDIEHFETAAEIITQLLSKNIQSVIPRLHVLNVNVPNVPMNKISGFKYTTPGIQNYTEEVIERKDGRGKSYYWVGGTYQGSEPIEGSDCEAVDQGFISLNLQDLSGNDKIDEQVISNFKAFVNEL